MNRRVTTGVITRKGRYGAPSGASGYFSLKLAVREQNVPVLVASAVHVPSEGLHLSVRPVGSLGWRIL